MKGLDGSKKVWKNNSVRRGNQSGEDQSLGVRKVRRHLAGNKKISRTNKKKATKY